MMDFRGEFFRNSEKDSRSYLTEEVRENYTGKAHKRLFDISSNRFLVFVVLKVPVFKSF